MLKRNPTEGAMASSTDNERTSPQNSSPTTTTPAPSSRAPFKQPIATTSPLQQFSNKTSIASTIETLPDAKQFSKFRSLPCDSNERVGKVKTGPSYHEAGRVRHRESQSFDPGTEFALPPSPILQPVGRQRTFSSNASTLIGLSRSILWCPEQSSEPTKPLSWRKKLWNKIPRGMLVKAAFEVFGLVLAVVSTFTYTYRSYQISLWQAEYSFYDHCMQTGRPPSDHCNVLLQKALQRPPYVPHAKQVQLQKRESTGDSELPPSTSWIWIIIFAIILTPMALLLFFYATPYLRQSRRARRAREAWYRYQVLRPASFLPFAQRHREELDGFSPVCVRMDPQRSPSATEASVTAVSRDLLLPAPGVKPMANSSLKRRVVPGVSCTNTDEVEVQDNRRWPENQPQAVSLTKIRDFECAVEEAGSEDDLLPAEISRRLSRRAATRPRTQVRSAPEGTPDRSTRTVRRKSRSSSSASLRRRVHSRWPRLPYIFPYDPSTDGLQPTLAALGERAFDDASNDRSEEDQTQKRPSRKAMVASGFVAIATAQTGAALASTIGGAIGQEILMQSEDGTRDMVAAMMPQAPQDR